MVMVNVDELNASLVGLFTDQARGQWAQGFQAGCSGVPAGDWPDHMIQGHAVGISAFRTSENYRAKKAAAGQESASRRRQLTGSAQPIKPERVPNSARTVLEQCSNDVRDVFRTPPELTNIQYPISKSENEEIREPGTEGHAQGLDDPKTVTTIEDEHDIAALPTQGVAQQDDAAAWGYQVGGTNWARALLAAGCKIGRSNWRAWEGLVARSFAGDAAACAAAALTLPADKRWPDQVEVAAAKTAKSTPTQPGRFARRTTLVTA